VVSKDKDFRIDCPSEKPDATKEQLFAYQTVLAELVNVQFFLQQLTQQLTLLGPPIIMFTKMGLGVRSTVLSSNNRFTCWCPRALLRMRNRPEGRASATAEALAL